MGRRRRVPLWVLLLAAALILLLCIGGAFAALGGEDEASGCGDGSITVAAAPEIAEPLEEALAKEGLTPGDIDQLILSHLHFDHAGGLQHFVGTKAIDHVLVSEADLKQAWWAVTTGNNGAYIRSLFDVEGIRFETIHDTTWLADDLGLFIQASHTPGVIGLILKTEHHGTILTTSDAIYTADSYRQALPPGGTINATTDEFYDNLERIKAMEKNYNATLLFGHDIDQILDWAGQGVID